MNALLNPPELPTGLALAPAGEVVDVTATQNLPRCACGGAPRHYRCDKGGHYFICRERCHRPGSGVFPTREQAERAWATLQAAAQP